jgi:hypothetical protein
MKILRLSWVFPVVALAMLVGACDSEEDAEQAQAQDQKQAQTGAPLTEDQVASFISTYPALRALGDKYAAAGAGGPSAFGAVMGQIKASQGYDEFAAVIKKHGFDDVEQWAEVANRVTMAYAALMMEDQSAQMKTQLEATRKQIEADTNMSPEQKKAVLKQLDASAGAMTGLPVSEADKAAVRPHRAALQQAMN